MKIAYVYDAIYPWVKGGAEKRVYELSKRLAKRGHEVHRYGMKWWEGNDEILENGVYLHGICEPMELYSRGRRSMKEAIYFASKVLFSLKEDYDLVDCQEFPYFPCFTARILSSFRGAEFFITWHEVWGDYWYEYLGWEGFFGKSIEEAVSKLTDKNIAVSERTRRDLEGLGVNGVQVVPNGIDFQAIEQVKASERESDVVYAGRLIGHKNVDLLIRAMGLVRQEVPDLRAIIIGDGPEIARLKELTRKLDLEENVEFAGFMKDYDEALAIMKSSRLFVLPSTREGFGMAALEAHACGLPVITVKHRMNAACDLVTEETGIICEPSEEGLRDAIFRGLEVGKNMRPRCIEMAQGYDWEKICKLAEKVYAL